MTATKGHVFVSHSSDNRELAGELAEFLETRGVRIWIAPRDVRPGMDYSEQLQLAIEEAVAFVVLVTDNANKSPYVRAETEMAFSTHKPIFPVRITDIQPAAGLAFFLKIRHWTDAFGNLKRNHLDRLARELQGLSGADIKGEAAAPAPPPPGPPLPAPSPPPSPPPPPPAAGAASAGAGAAAAASLSGTVPALPLAPATPEQEEKWRAAVGPKADFFLERWQQMAEKKSSTSWSWAACLANLFWFAYRKMWLPMAAMIFLYLINVAVMTNPQATKVMSLVSIGVTFLTGLFGVHLYRQQTARLVAETAGQDRAAALETLRRRGGVSMPALWGAIGAVVVLVLISAAMVVRQAQTQLNGFGPADQFNSFNSPDQFNTIQPAPDKPVTSDDLAAPEEPPPEEPPPDPNY